MLAAVCGIVAVYALASGCGSDAPFTPPPPTPACTFSLSTSALTFGVPGGTAQIGVSTASHCSWTARAEADWLTIEGGVSGTGPGTVTVAAARNAGDAERDARVVVADLPVAVHQACLSACTFQISPASGDVRSDGGGGVIAVTAADHCEWTAASRASWISIRSGASGKGAGQVEYRADPNPDPLDRSGTIDVAGQVFTLRQDGDPSGCQYSVAPISFSPCMTSGEMTASISTSEGCPWTATAGADWLTVVSGSSGSGSGLVTFRAADNWDPPRSSVVMVRWPTPTAGQNLQVAQAGCYYSVSRTDMSFPAAGGSGTFDVYQMADPNTCGGPLQDRCLWTATASASWITITSSLPRTGDQPLSFTVAANDGAARSATITVRDKVVRIDQAAR